MNQRIAFLYVAQKVKANLKADIYSNYLGIVWWFLEPAMFVCVFYIVFGLLFNRAGEDFLQILIVGITAWLWIASAVSKSSISIFGARVLMAQVYIPKYCMPAVIVVESLVKHLAVSLVLFTFLYFTSGIHFSWGWFPLLLMVQFLLISAVSFWVAALVPFIPDLRYLVTAGLQMLMFCSGVFFRTLSVPEKYQFLMTYNPVANLLQQYRAILVYGEHPDLIGLGIIAGTSGLLLLLAIIFLKKFDLYYPRLIN